jgi:hypothetical protein
VYKSEDTKSCVLETNCASNVNLDNVEFAFTCKLDNMVQKHSFGKGGFDSQEKFDTSVKCNSCGLPTEVNLALKKHHTEKKKQDPAPADTTDVTPAADPDATPVVEETKVDHPDLVKYGPSECVSTWLKADATVNEDGEKGQCVVQTTCASVEKEAFEDYPVGLICVDKSDVPVRHLFGSNSFDPEEEFDTLVRCTKCLGLDEVSENVTLEAEMKGLSSILTHVANDVSEIKAGLGTAGASTDDADAGDSASGSFLVRKHRTHEAPKKQATKEAPKDQEETVVEDVYDDE